MTEVPTPHRAEEFRRVASCHGGMAHSWCYSYSLYQLSRRVPGVWRAGWKISGDRLLFRPGPALGHAVWGQREGMHRECDGGQRECVVQHSPLSDLQK